jgi:hypothetical protein
VETQTHYTASPATQPAFTSFLNAPSLFAHSSSTILSELALSHYPTHCQSTSLHLDRARAAIDDTVHTFWSRNRRHKHTHTACRNHLHPEAQIPSNLLRFTLGPSVHHQHLHQSRTRGDTTLRNYQTFRLMRYMRKTEKRMTDVVSMSRHPSPVANGVAASASAATSCIPSSKVRTQSTFSAVLAHTGPVASAPWRAL